MLEHYAKTGSGLNACMASGQLAWMKRHQPERIARATTAFHCKDWLYFKLTGERATDPAEANFTFGNYRTRRYEPSILAAMGIADCERLLPPIVDGASIVTPVQPRRRPRPGCRRACRSCSVISTWSAPALGGGLYEPDSDVGVSDLRLDRHAHALRRDAGRGSPQQIALRLRHAVPDPRRRGHDAIEHGGDAQYRLAARHRARGRDVGPAPRSSRAALLKGMDARVLDAAPGSAIYHPYIFEAGERGPFLDPNARAHFSGLSTRTSLAGMMRAVYEGLAFAARDCYAASGAPPREVRLGGGAARSTALRADSRLHAGRLGAYGQARGNRRRGRGDDRGGLPRRLWRHGAMRERLGDAVAGRGDRARPDLERPLRQALSDLPGYPCEQCRRPGRRWPKQDG